MGIRGGVAEEEEFISKMYKSTTVAPKPDERLLGQQYLRATIAQRDAIMYVLEIYQAMLWQSILQRNFCAKLQQIAMQCYVFLKA